MVFRVEDARMGQEEKQIAHLFLAEEKRCGARNREDVMAKNDFLFSRKV